MLLIERKGKRREIFVWRAPTERIWGKRGRGDGRKLSVQHWFGWRSQERGFWGGRYLKKWNVGESRLMERKEGEGERRVAGKGTGGEVFPYFIQLTHTHTHTLHTQSIACLLQPACHPFCVRWDRGERDHGIKKDEQVSIEGLYRGRELMWGGGGRGGYLSLALLLAISNKIYLTKQQLTTAYNSCTPVIFHSQAVICFNYTTR